MKGKITEETVVENLLSEYSIKGLNDPHEKSALIAALLNGEKPMIEFEKTIVPADNVDWYFVVEHVFPTTDPGDNHFTCPVASTKKYDEALQSYYRHADNDINKDTDIEEVKQYLLVGEFKDKSLDFDMKGFIDVNTGIILRSILTDSNTSYSKAYPDKQIDPTIPVTISTSLYVQLDRESASLKFEQNGLNHNELDLDVWKVDSAKDLGNKQRINSGAENDDLTNKRKCDDFSTEQWVADPLLRKRSNGKSHGKGIH